MIVRIVNYLYPCPCQEKEIFQYGLEAITSTLLCLGLALFCCCLLHKGIWAVCFISLLTLIKMQLTGYHCQSKWMCSLFYTGMVLLNVLLYQSSMTTYTSVFLILLCFIGFTRKSEMTLHTICLLFIYALLYFFYSPLSKMIYMVLGTQCFLIAMVYIKASLNTVKRRNLK